MHSQLRLTLTFDEHRDLERATAGLMDLLPDDARERAKLNAMTSSNGKNPTAVEDAWHALNGLEMLLDICLSQSDPQWWAENLNGMGGLVARDGTGLPSPDVSGGLAASRQAQARDLGAVLERLTRQVEKFAQVESLLPGRDDEHLMADHDVTHAEHEGRRLVRNDATGQWWEVDATGGRRPLLLEQAVRRAVEWVAAGGTLREVDGGSNLVNGVRSLLPT